MSQEPRKSPTTKIVLGLAVAAIIVIAIMAVIASKDPTQHPSPPTGPTFSITAEMVVDTMGTATIAEFCRSYFTIANYDLAFAAFESSYGSAKEPSAEAVFDEAISRC
jgi:hypothetical protein